jgi:predicted nucleic acid-binding protein
LTVDAGVLYSAADSRDPEHRAAARALQLWERELVTSAFTVVEAVADASMVVLAQRYSTRTIATFDDRHFRSVAPLSGGAFELLPADAGR